MLDDVQCFVRYVRSIYNILYCVRIRKTGWHERIQVGGMISTAQNQRKHTFVQGLFVIVQHRLDKLCTTIYEYIKLVHRPDFENDAEYAIVLK